MSLIYVHPNSNGKLFQAGAKEIYEIIKNNKIDILILSAKEFQPNSNKFSKEVKDLLSSSTIYYLPLDDCNKIRISDVQGVNELGEICAKAIISGKNVLSTCWMGRNRSGLISGTILKNITGASGNAVVKHIKTYRQKNALSNRLFVKILNNFKT